MTSSPSSNDRPSTDASQRPDHGPILLTALMMLGVAWLIASEHPLLTGRPRPPQLQSLQPVAEPPPLAMQGGDPYLRALMRTISAAESNTAAPYHTLYGGQQIQDLSRHPDRCIKIVAGPNTGDCTTAAGRYQFLTTTWDRKAREYHPDPARWYQFGASHSFEPVFQDRVVYRWLSDRHAWGVDIPAMLRQGRLQEVLKILSGTWTSLGYGIEDNAMTPYLAQVYEAMLQQELQRSGPASQ